jgi:copper homeostasis protein (lipoprotein)
VPDLRNTDQTAVTYAGTLPCADCEGQYIVLTLFPDSTFRIRTSYLGNRSDTGQDFYDLGRWNYPENNADRILLRGAGKVPLQLNRLPDGTLRQLDQSGQPIVSQLNYELKRQQTIDMVAGPMQLRGMYLYLADAANLVECQTGKRLPILMVVDHAELERAYLAGRRHPGDEMLVSLVARFVEQAPEPGLPLREHLVVKKFERAMPGENCAAMAQKPPPRLTTF